MVNLNTFGAFNQGRRGYVTYLSPTPEEPIRALYSTIQRECPNLPANFRQPHMTVARGQQVVVRVLE